MLQPVAMKLSVVVPMLNEERVIAATVRAIRAGAPGAELIVVDGGSSDRSVEIAGTLCDRVIEAPRGRARQMNAGAHAASGDALVFVHADTTVPPNFACEIEQAMRDQRVVGGRFDVMLDDPSLACRVLGVLISMRSRLSRVGTGDQAIFVRRNVFQRLGGFPEIELCEDLEFSRRLKRVGGVACLRSRVTTSARRWRKYGLLRTVVRMWLLKSLFLAGVSPSWLKRRYTDTR
ncbi:MAG: TIGR04283 family arsenosugar biosynthesis glycosyltransferase [Candidatus Binataceae bacterium]